MFRRLLILLLALLAACLFNVDARTSSSADEFMQHRFRYHGYNSPPQIDATDEFRNHCVKVKNDRLVVFKPESSSNGNHQKFRSGTAFLATDLCAMGHTAKDAPLLLSWALDAESFGEAEMMQDAFSAFCQHLHTDGNSSSSKSRNSYCIAPSHKKEEQEEFSHRRRSPPLRYVLFGNMCMSRDSKVLPNKRSPVFHKVLWDWFRAVEGRLRVLRSKREKKHDREQQQQQQGLEEIFMTGDFTGDTAKYSTLCFENIVVRQERWRWVRSSYHADQFRIALWSHFDVKAVNQVAKLSAMRLAVVDDHSNRIGADDESDLLFDALRPNVEDGGGAVLPRAIARLGTTDKNNEEDLLMSLRSRFPTSVLPLRVTVLVRDEDRHFHETEVGNFIQSHFGSGLVDVRMEKFDSIRGGGKPPPSHKEQLQILFDTDILIAAHGAGLAAVLAMRPGTAVIEFFPHNFAYFMYAEAAQLSRVFYRRYESPRVWPRRCCSVAQAAYRNFTKPMFLNGLGARACKKCDTFVTPQVISDLVAEAIRRVAIAHN